MEFVKSDYKFSNKKKNIVAPAANSKGGLGGLYSNFPSGRKRKDNMAHVLSFREREKLKQEDKCYHCKQTGHMALQYPQKKPMTSSYQRINQQQYQNRNRNPKVKPAALNMETQLGLMQVMKGPTQSRTFIIPEARKETMAAEITINGYKAYVLLDPCTQGRDLISNNFFTVFKLPLTQMEKKPLEIAIQGSRSPMTNKTIVLINVQGYEEESTFYAAHLRNWDAILGEPVIKKLKAIMNIHDNIISIQPSGMARYDLIMLQKTGNDSIRSAAMWMQSTCKTAGESTEHPHSDGESDRTSDSESMKDYANDETDYEDSSDNESITDVYEQLRQLGEENRSLGRTLHEAIDYLEGRIGDNNMIRRQQADMHP